MSKKHNSIETESNSEWRLTANWQKESFQGDENVLKPDCSSDCTTL